MDKENYKFDNVHFNFIDGLAKINTDRSVTINKVLDENGDNKGVYLYHNNTLYTSSIIMNLSGVTYLLAKSNISLSEKGARDEIVRAIEAGARTEEEITNIICKDAPEPDLIIRPGGQSRLSNFLLWQSAYSELVFLFKYFPALSEDDLDIALNEYNSRKRSYGK